MIPAASGSLGRARTLLGLQFLSDFGDQITTAILALCILDISQSTAEVGMVYALSVSGFLVFTFLGGYIGDRLSKRIVVGAADLGRCLVVLLMIAALSLKSLPLIYATSFFLSILGSLHKPVKLSLWARWVPDQNLERYNGYSELSIQSSAVLGPLIAGAFVAADWASGGLFIDASTFLICGLVFLWLLQSRDQEDNAPSRAVRTKVLGGFRQIRSKELARNIGYDAIQMIGFGAFNATFLVLAQRDFGWTKGEYSFHLSTIAAFTVAAAILGSSSWVNRWAGDRKLAWCAIGSATCLWLALALGSFPVSSILIGLCDGLAVLTMPVTRSRAQRYARTHCPDSVSSVLAARSIVIKLATLVGIGGCLIVDDFLPLNWTLGLFGLPIALSAVLFTPLSAPQTRPPERRPLEVTDT